MNELAGSVRLTPVLSGPLAVCPACGQASVQVVALDLERGSAHHVCRSCRRCWLLEDDLVSQVEPDDCPEWVRPHLRDLTS